MRCPTVLCSIRRNEDRTVGDNSDKSLPHSCHTSVGLIARTYTDMTVPVDFIKLHAQLYVTSTYDAREFNPPRSSGRNEHCSA